MAADSSARLPSSALVWSETGRRAPLGRPKLSSRGCLVVPAPQPNLFFSLAPIFKRVFARFRLDARQLIRTPGNLKLNIRQRVRSLQRSNTVIHGVTMVW